MGNVLEGTAEDWANRPQQSDPFAAGPRKSLGPGYDWLIELMRQIGRPAAFIMCLTAGFYQIAAPPELRLDGLTFGVFMGLLGAMCGIRAAELSLPAR